MTIETKFNQGENVFFIENNDIVSFPVDGIEYKNGTITYSFIKSKALTLMDRDNVVYKDEKNCYKSIDELSNFYKNGK